MATGYSTDESVTPKLDTAVLSTTLKPFFLSAPFPNQPCLRLILLFLSKKKST